MATTVRPTVADAEEGADALARRARDELGADRDGRDERELERRDEHREEHEGDPEAAVEGGEQQRARDHDERAPDDAALLAPPVGAAADVVEASSSRPPIPNTTADRAAVPTS